MTNTLIRHTSSELCESERAGYEYRIAVLERALVEVDAKLQMRGCPDCCELAFKERHQ